jgi:16S rRNA (adenine1518-N6/adenine1519-N6)-dimethyltransferase
MSQPPRVITEMLSRHGIRPRKAYGQHFLADPNIIRKVVSLAGVESGDRVVEVGAGTGALTAALARAGARLVAYELDERLRPVLEEALAGLEVDLRFVDVMDVDLADELDGSPWKLVANLPYNVGTPLVLEVLRRVPAVESLVVMMQKEVADRLVAAPGTSEYGLPSVVVSLTAEADGRFGVPPQVFVPPPRVESTVLRLDRKPAPADLEQGLDLARRAFGQRRKMLRSSLAEKCDADLFARTGIASTARPEQLGPEQFLVLARGITDG